MSATVSKLVRSILREPDPIQKAKLIVELFKSKEPKIEIDLTLPEKIPENQIIQNRDRGKQNSIAQMQRIASNPDFLRLADSHSFASGCPIIGYGTYPVECFGNKDMAVTEKGNKYPVQYAVVEADSVLTSHDADGIENKGFSSDDPTNRRAIAGNGRIAGLLRAYEKGTAEQYRKDLTQAAAGLGINPKYVESLKRPILVRVMQPKDIKADIGDESNMVTNLQMTRFETAKNDANRIDTRGLELDSDWKPTTDSLMKFINAMPEQERGGLMDFSVNGEAPEPAKEAQRRCINAMFINAYDVPVSDDIFIGAKEANVAEFLLNTKEVSLKPNQVAITSALYYAAPAIQKLKGLDGNYDIRRVITEAAVMALNALNSGRSIEEESAQVSMAYSHELREACNLIMKIFAQNRRSYKKAGEELIKIATALWAEATKDDGGWFSDDEKVPPLAVIQKAMQVNAKQQTLGFDSVVDSTQFDAIDEFWNSRAGVKLLRSILDDTYTLGDVYKTYSYWEK